MKAVIATLVGGVHDGRRVAIGTDDQYIDVPVPSSDPSKSGSDRFRKKLWARLVDEATREIATDTYFVLDSLSDQEATTALLRHIRSSNSGLDLAPAGSS